MKKEETIKIRLEKEEKDKLQKIAEKEKRTMSEWIRKKIEENK